MNKEMFDEAVEWNPVFTAEQQARVDEHRKRFIETAHASMFKKARTLLGISQVEAARRLDTSQANVSKIEKRSKGDVSQLEKLADGSDYEIVVILRSKDHKHEIVLSE